MRRQRDQAVARRAEHKRSLLYRRLAKVSAASRTVASCLIANAAVKKRERFRLTRAAVAMVRVCRNGDFGQQGHRMSAGRSQKGKALTTSLVEWILS